jgi:hypothetical protein
MKTLCSEAAWKMILIEDSRQENLTYSISNLDSEIIRLRSRVVQSPNRIKESLATQSAMVAKMKEEIIELDRKALDHQARIKVIKAYETVSLIMTSLVMSWALSWQCLNLGCCIAHQGSGRMGGRAQSCSRRRGQAQQAYR